MTASESDLEAYRWRCSRAWKARRQLGWLEICSERRRRDPTQGCLEGIARVGGRRVVRGGAGEAALNGLGEGLGSLQVVRESAQGERDAGGEGAAGDDAGELGACTGSRDGQRAAAEAEGEMQRTGDCAQRPWRNLLRHRSHGSNASWSSLVGVIAQ
eukprot:4973413-Prymnesium_polylepis.2